MSWDVMCGRWPSLLSCLWVVSAHLEPFGISKGRVLGCGGLDREAMPLREILLSAWRADMG